MALSASGMLSAANVLRDLSPLGHTVLINRYLLFPWTSFLLVDLGSSAALMCWEQGAMNLSAAY